MMAAERLIRAAAGATGRALRGAAMRACLAAAAGALGLLAGCAGTAPQAAGGEPLFAVLGDAPYSQAQANLLDGLLDEIEAARPAFVVHVGDITSGQGPCGDDWLLARQRQFARLSAPFVMVFGDNEWTDCHRGGFDPLERLGRLRQIFHARDPALADFARQSADARFAEYREHVRWTAGQTLYVALNVPGSNNNLGRTPAMDAEHERRMSAVFEWLDEAFKFAELRRLSAVVLFMQANPGLDARIRLRPGSADGFAALRRVLVTQARWFEGPVILVHGDTHEFRVDRPLAGAASLVRIETDGWPQLGWLGIRVSPAQGEPASVQRHLLR
jgi:hypothetical protein